MASDAKQGSSMLDDLRAKFGPRFLATARERVRRSVELLTVPDGAQKLITELHSLAGESSMLGLQEISDTARKGEEDAKAWDKGSTTAKLYCARTVRALSQMVEAFAASVSAGGAPPAATPAEPAGRPPSSQRQPTDPSIEPPAAPASRVRAPSSRRARSAGSRGRVLVIDDSELAGDQLGDSLQDRGCEVRLAVDRDTAIAAVGEFQPDLAACDVHMPGVDLAELCHAIRDAATSPVTIVLVSGMSDDELAVRAREVEADGYVSKRAGLDQVIQRLCSTFEEASED